DKRIWFLSYNGHLSFYKNGKIYNESNAPFLKGAFCGQSIHTMHEDGKNRLWINSYGNNIILIENETVKRFIFKRTSSLAGGIGIYIREDGDPEFRVDHDIYEYDAATRTIVFQKKGEFSYMVQRPSYSESDTSFTIVQNGIIRKVNGKEKLIVSFPRGELPFYFTCLYYEKNGILWAATIEYGVEVFRLEKDTAILIQKFLDNLQISEIMKDKEGNFWICSKDEGVYMLTSFGRAFTIYSKADNFPTQNIYSLFHDRQGNLWTGGDHGAVTKIDSKGKIDTTYKLYSSQQINYRVIDIDQDKEDNIWITTSFKTHKIDKHGKETLVYNTKNYF